MILGLLVATFIQWIFTLGLSELASAFPSSGVSRRISKVPAICAHWLGTIPLRLYPSPQKIQAIFVFFYRLVLCLWMVDWSQRRGSHRR